MEQRIYVGLFVRFCLHVLIINSMCRTHRKHKFQWIPVVLIVLAQKVNSLTCTLRSLFCSLFCFVVSMVLQTEHNREINRYHLSYMCKLIVLAEWKRLENRKKGKKQQKCEDLSQYQVLSSSSSSSCPSSNVQNFQHSKSKDLQQDDAVESILESHGIRFSARVGVDVDRVIRLISDPRFASALLKLSHSI